jgi:uncharacterized membrane protein YgcG
MRRTLTLILGVALFGIMAAVVVASQGADDPVGTQGTTNTTETVEHTNTVEDNPARHNRRAKDDSPAQTGVDISGPCDEAEHANDPRCIATPNTAPTAPRVDDNPGADDNGGNRVDNSGPGSQNSGPGSLNSGRDDEVGDDRGGDNEVENEVEHHGGGDDSSGHGGGGNSGHGGGGNDD